MICYHSSLALYYCLAITAQLRALADQQRTSAKDAAKIAAEQVAAKLNQSIGVAGAVTGGGVGPHAGLGLVVSEEWAIPNRVVGLGMYCINNSWLDSGCILSLLYQIKDSL